MKHKNVSFTCCSEPVFCSFSHKTAFPPHAAKESGDLYCHTQKRTKKIVVHMTLMDAFHNVIWYDLLVPCVLSSGLFI